jgi:hypothetical protein
MNLVGGRVGEWNIFITLTKPTIKLAIDYCRLPWLCINPKGTSVDHFSFVTEKSIENVKFFSTTLVA